MPNQSPDGTRRADWPGLAGCALLAAGTVAIYGRTFSVPLLLDDFAPIAGNPSIRRLWPIWTVLSPSRESVVGGRPVVNLSYAVNYAAGGTAVSGYHLVNLIVHVLAGWTLFALVRRTLLSPVLAERFGRNANSLALAVSAVWAWHPLQTESVTYISERAESLMGLFYLLTLYCFVRYADETGDRLKAIGGKRGPQADTDVSDDTELLSLSPAAYRLSPLLWGLLSIGACLLGMATKEVMVTAPVMVLLYDRTFVSGSFSNSWRRHGSLYLLLAGTWLPMGYFMIGLHYRDVGFGQGVSWWIYGLTECRVVVKYLLLAFWPKPLVFDYGSVVAAGLSAIWPYAAALACLLAATVIALRRSPGVAFAACWFFLILAPTSSVVPIVEQTMAENRMYLPLAGIVALVVLGAFALAGRWTLPVFALVAAGLGVVSAVRNRDYSSEESIWSDTVAKSPANPRAHNNLANAWLSMPGRLNDAVAQYEEALRLKPDYAEAHNNLGNALLRLSGRLNDAIAQYEEAMRLRPDNPEVHNNLGHALSITPGRLDDAIAQYEEALRLKPDYAEAHNNLGNAWLRTPGRWDDAIAQYEEALRSKPNYAEAHNNLGNAWLRTPGRLDDAIAQYEEALRLKPDFAEVHFNLAVALLSRPGQTDEAEAQLEAFLRLQPGNDAALQLLARIRASRP